MISLCDQLTCARSREALSASSVLLSREARPRSAWRASAASRCPPTAAALCAPGSAGERRTAATRGSFWPSTAGGTLRCGQTPRAAWASCRCARTAPRPLSGSPGCPTPWTDPPRWSRTCAGPGSRTPAAAPASGHLWYCRGERSSADQQRRPRRLRVRKPGEAFPPATGVSSKETQMQHLTSYNLKTTITQNDSIYFKLLKRNLQRVREL